MRENNYTRPSKYFSSVLWKVEQNLNEIVLWILGKISWDTRPGFEVVNVVFFENETLCDILENKIGSEILIQKKR